MYTKELLSFLLQFSRNHLDLSKDGLFREAPLESDVKAVEVLLGRHRQDEDQLKRKLKTFLNTPEKHRAAIAHLKKALIASLLDDSSYFIKPIHACLWQHVQADYLPYVERMILDSKTQLIPDSARLIDALIGSLQKHGAYDSAEMLHNFFFFVKQHMDIAGIEVNPMSLFIGPVLFDALKIKKAINLDHCSIKQRLQQKIPSTFMAQFFISALSNRVFNQLFDSLQYQGKGFSTTKLEAIGELVLSGTEFLKKINPPAPAPSNADSPSPKARIPMKRRRKRGIKPRNQPPTPPTRRREKQKLKPKFGLAGTKSTFQISTEDLRKAQRRASAPEEDTEPGPEVTPPLSARPLRRQDSTVTVVNPLQKAIAESRTHSSSKSYGEASPLPLTPALAQITKKLGRIQLSSSGSGSSPSQSPQSNSGHTSPKKRGS